MSAPSRPWTRVPEGRMTTPEPWDLCPQLSHTIHQSSVFGTCLSCLTHGACCLFRSLEGEVNAFPQVTDEETEAGT